MMGLLVLTTATLVHARAYPYREDFLSHVELYSLSTSCITFFLGQISYILGSSHYRTVAAVLALAANVAYLMLMLFLGVYMVHEDYSAMVEHKTGLFSSVSGPLLLLTCFLSPCVTAIPLFCCFLLFLTLCFRRSLSSYSCSSYVLYVYLVFLMSCVNILCA